MKITESALGSQAQSMHWEYRRQEESLRIEVRAPERAEASASTQVQLSAEGVEASQAKSPEELLDNKLQILVSVIEMLTGRRVKLFDPAELSGDPKDARAPSDSNAERGPELDIGIHYEARSVREEAEAVRYEASGRVQTADGRAIEFALQLDMARYEYEESSIVLNAGTARPKDPLVLNLGTDRVRLEDTRFSFDLEGDGKAESLARLGSGSFFLALDRNDNGKIDSGKELFGPQSGDGFADLATLDDDGNGWIDESDAAFGRLRLWRPDESAQSLTEAGVGALSLDRRATPYTLKTDDGTVAGAIRSTGLYLSEDGQAGTLQQIDLMA